jgi:hypothetical protein
MIATTGGRQVFVKEVLGDAFDSQAEHFLHGDVDVDGGAIRWEAMIVNGKARMYFGPFPSLLRIPLNLLYPTGRGAWSRISGFLAGELALIAFTGLVSNALSGTSLSARARFWLGAACLVGLLFATPLLFLLGNLSIYCEAIIWGLAWLIAALFFAWHCRTAEAEKLTISLLGFSISAACALLSRVTFGAPLVLVAPLLAMRLPRAKRLRNFTALLIPLGAGILVHVLLNYAKFGSLTGASYDFYINSAHREFARHHGIFDLHRLPYSFADYFNLTLPSFHLQRPFLTVDRHPIPHSEPFSLPLSETFISLSWSSAWLVATAILGAVCLFWRGRSDYFLRWIAAALLIEFIGILSYFALAERYAADLCPLLVFCLIVFLSAGGIMLVRARYIFCALIIVSGAVNLLAVSYWLGSDRNLPVETQSFWSAIAGLKQPPIK